MVRNKEKYEQALQFRKRGFTLEEVAKICDVSKSTVSKWLKNNAISADITKQNKRRAGTENAKRLKLVNKTRNTERTARYKEAVHSADTEYKHYKKTPLFVAGVMLYLANGDMQNEATIRLSTTHINTHKIFISFAKEYLGVAEEKIHIWLQLYSDHVEASCMKKWHKELQLPYNQFYKNHVIKQSSRRKTLHHGVGNTIIGSTVLKRKLIRWIELTEAELSQ